MLSSFFDFWFDADVMQFDCCQVELNFSIRSSMHAITDSYYKCGLRNSGVCNLKIPLPGGTAALLTTPEPLEVRNCLFGCMYVYSWEGH